MGLLEEARLARCAASRWRKRAGREDRFWPFKDFIVGNF
jgi:hypothetical protein